MDQLVHRSLLEDRQHGTDSFPLATYWMTQIPGDGVLDCHWHNEAEFFYVINGELTFQVDTDYFTVLPGEAVFIDAGDIHAGYAIDGQAVEFFAMVFDPKVLHSHNFDLVQEQYIVPWQQRTRTFPRHLQPTNDWHQPILHCLEAICHKVIQQESGIEAFIKGQCYLMLHELNQEGRAENRSEATGADHTKIERLKTVIAYMKEHYHRPVRIQELAALIPMSEGQFCRFFKKMTRQTPIEYINMLRIKHASELLRQSDRKISDIAMDVGFDHISYFIKTFRKSMRVTPSDYRKSAR